MGEWLCQKCGVHYHPHLRPGHKPDAGKEAGGASAEGTQDKGSKGGVYKQVPSGQGGKKAGKGQPQAGDTSGPKYFRSRVLEVPEEDKDEDGDKGMEVEEEPIPSAKEIRQFQGAYQRLNKMAKNNTKLVTDDMAEAVEKAGRELEGTIKEARIKRESTMAPKDRVARKTGLLEGLHSRAKELADEQVEAEDNFKAAQQWITDLEQRQMELQFKISDLEEEKAQAEARLAAEKAEEAREAEEAAGTNRAARTDHEGQEPGGEGPDWSTDPNAPTSMLGALRFLSNNWMGTTGEDNDLLLAIGRVLQRQNEEVQDLGATAKGSGKAGGRRTSPGEGSDEEDDEVTRRSRSPRSRWAERSNR